LQTVAGPYRQVLHSKPRIDLLCVPKVKHPVFHAFLLQAIISASECAADFIAASVAPPFISELAHDA